VFPRPKTRPPSSAPAASAASIWRDSSANGRCPQQAAGSPRMPSRAKMRLLDAERIARAGLVPECPSPGAGRSGPLMAGAELLTSAARPGGGRAPRR
jgi:hypothetical protein